MRLPIRKASNSEQGLIKNFNSLNQGTDRQMPSEGVALREWMLLSLEKVSCRLIILFIFGRDQFPE
jgi:hypothetical protein